MNKNPFPLTSPKALALLAIVATLTVSAVATASTLEVSVVYEGPGQVDENHGLMVFVFAGNDFGSPANPIVATRYLTTNGVTTRFEDLGVEQVWLMAVHDEKGGYTTGPLPGPFALYSDTPGGPPTGVPLGGEAIALRFDDSNRMPSPQESKPTATFETLQAAEGGIVEIRIYRVKPGTRDEFVRFFEDTLEAQAAAGLRVLGQFRSLDDENTFVWIRAFRDQKERQERSRAFYLGPAWMEERRAQAAKFLESGEVMLVEPTGMSLIW